MLFLLLFPGNNTFEGETRFRDALKHWSHEISILLLKAALVGPKVTFSILALRRILEGMRWHPTKNSSEN
jgi:hypothetical protein